MKFEFTNAESLFLISFIDKNVAYCRIEQEAVRVWEDLQVWGSWTVEEGAH